MSQDHEFDSLVDASITTNGGASYFWVRAPARTRVRVIHTNSVVDTDYYETEMLQLDISGGDFPPPVRIRQSPTTRSRGQLTIQPATGGGYHINSFFDVSTELSVNGGATWFPSTSPARMVLTSPSPEVPTASDRLPVLASRYISARGFSAPYLNGLIISNVIHYGFTTNHPPPPPVPNSSVVHNFGSEVEFGVSSDGGMTFSAHRAPANTSVRVTHMTNAEGTRYLQTEMLQLDVSGGTLPPQVRVRESPVKASLGRTHIRSSGGGVMVGSYFDIFTEVSLDNGQNWSPALCPHPVIIERTSTPRPIPTLSEWGLIIMALLLLTVGSIYLLRPQLPGFTGMTFVPFARALFMRVLTAAALLWVGAVTAIALTAGALHPRDVMGSLLATVIISYWLHVLLVRPTRQAG